MRPRHPTQDQALRLIHRYSPEVPVRTLQAHDMGWDCRVFESEGGVMFRFPRREENRRWMERSLRYYPLLERVVPVAIPRPTLVGRGPTGKLLFTGYPKIPGAALPTKGLEGPSARLWVEQLVEVLRALERVPRRQAVAAGFPAPSVKERKGIWHRRFFRVMRDLRPVLTSEEYREERQFFREVLADPAFFPKRTSLTHYDLFPHHILVGPGQTGIQGILDWEDACVADPAGDLSVLPLDGGFALRVLDAWHPGDEALWARSRVMAHWCLGHEARDKLLHGPKAEVAAAVRRFLGSRP